MLNFVGLGFDFMLDYLPLDIVEIIKNFIPICQECNRFGCQYFGLFDILIFNISPQICYKAGTKISYLQYKNKIAKFKFCGIPVINKFDGDKKLHVMFNEKQHHICDSLEKFVNEKYDIHHDHQNKWSDRNTISINPQTNIYSNGVKVSFSNLHIGNLISITMKINIIHVNEKYYFSPKIKRVDIE